MKAIEVRLLSAAPVEGALDGDVSLDVGNALQGGTVNAVATVENIGLPGSAPIGVFGVIISGPDAPEFSDDLSGPTLLAPGDVLDVTVSLNPASLAPSRQISTSSIPVRTAMCGR